MTNPLDQLPPRIAEKLHYEPTTGCLIWSGAHARGQRGGGYGSVNWKGSNRQAHRVVFELLVRGGKKLPKRLTLDHVKARGCATNLCCNPDHLQPVSQGENNRRSTCHAHCLTRPRRADGSWV